MKIVCESDRKQGVGYFATGLLLMMNSCSIPLIHAGPEYYIGYVNKTGRDLSGVSVYYGNLEAGGKARLVRAGTATEGIITLPVPSEAEMHWVDGEKTNAVKVLLRGVVPKRLTTDWTLYFVINSNGTVQAKAIKDDDEVAKDELWKGLHSPGEYRVGFVNKTGHGVEAISVTSGGTKLLDHPRLFGGADTYSGFLSPPIPSEAEVQWKHDGALHAVKVKLEGVPKGFEGRIFLVIKADNTVEVHPIKNGDDKAAFKEVK
jgi:hypothetical protein